MAENSPRLSRFARVAFTAFLVAASILLRWLLDPVFLDRAPLPLMVVAVAIIAHRIGSREAAAAAVAGYIACAILFIEPRGELFPANWTRELVALFIYGIANALVIWMASRARGTRESLEEHVRAQRLLAAIVTSSNEAIVSIDTQGCITTWNDGATRLYGWTADEAIGKHIRMLVPGDRLDAELQLLADVMLGRVMSPRETLRCRKDGSSIEVMLTLSPIRDRDGRIIGVSKSAGDITERKTAERAAKAAYQALAASEARFNAFMANTPVTSFIKDADGRYLFVNRTLERVYGRPATDWVGKTDHEIFNPADADSYRRNDLAVMASDESRQFVEREGDRWYFAFKFPLADFDGTRLLGGAALDVSELKRAERAAIVSEQRLAAVLESIDDHLVSYDHEWRYTYVNEAGARVVGKTVDELLGRCIWDVFPHAVGNKYHAALTQAARERKKVQFEHYYEPFDTWFENHIYPTDDGVTVFASNVTYRKRAEQALRESDRRKDEFLALLAHELRNPLAPIRNAERFLQGRTPDDQEAQVALEIIGRQLDHLVRLVDDLLDVSRINRGKIELHREHVSLSWVLTNAVESVRPLLEAQQHDLDLLLPEEPVMLDADLTRLTQVFLNLLSNAARYTPAGGRIVVTATPHEDHVSVVVRDNGIGIPKEMLSQVFELFVQVDRSLERTAGGLGIGLTLVHRLVEMHGGSITARSGGDGLGSEFEVQLPVVASPVRNSRGAVAPPTGMVPRSQRRILVVDDNRDSADTLAMLFNHRGHEVRVAYDGQAALDVAREYLPDTVLLDIGLPFMNGYDVATHLRAQVRTSGDTVAAPLPLLLVAISGWGQEEDRRRSREAGFDHHMVKPVEFATLITLVESTRTPASSLPVA